jgi:single-stranded-DNA-specific exonuclease
VQDPRARGKWANGEDKWLLDLVAIGTISDMVPLIDENRALAHWGLVVLSKTKRPGLKELMSVARIGPTVSSRDVGFGIGPRINAAGRVADAKLAYNLLVESDPVKARTLALEVEGHNTERKKQMEYVERDARLLIDFSNPRPFIVLKSSEWPPGTLGFVANRIKDSIGRPVLLAHESGDMGRASLRSPAGFSLMEALESIVGDLIQYGGHPQAAGCTFKLENFEKIKLGLEKYAKESLDNGPIVQEVRVDCELSPTDVNIKNAELVERLAPFGMGNPIPQFLVRNLLLKDVRMLGMATNTLNSFSTFRRCSFFTTAKSKN